MSTDNVWSKLICFNKAASVEGKDDGEWMEPIRRRSREKSSRGRGAARRTGGASRRNGAKSEVETSNVAGKEPKAKAARRRSTVDLEDDDSDDDSGHGEEVDAAVNGVDSDMRDASRNDLPFGERLAMMLIRSVFSEEAVLRTAREIRGGSDSVGGSISDDDDEEADIVISFIKPNGGGAGDSESCDAEEVDDNARAATCSNIDSADEPDEAHCHLEAAASNPVEGGMRRVTSSNSIDRQNNKSLGASGGMRRVTSANAIDRMSKLDGIPEYSDRKNKLDSISEFSGVRWNEKREDGTMRKNPNSKLIKRKNNSVKKAGCARRATESQIVDSAENPKLLSQFSGISELSGATWDEAREVRSVQKTPNSKLVEPKNKNAKKGEWAGRATESRVVGSKERPKLLSQFSDAAWC